MKLHELVAKIRDSHPDDANAAELEGLINGNFLADRVSLRAVLQALYGPPHHIQELIVLRDFQDSPVRKLFNQFNDQCGN